MAGKKGRSGRGPAVPVNYDARFKKKVIAAINKAKREHDGRDVFQVAIDMMYDQDIQDSVRASIFKVIKEAFVTQKSEQKIEATDNTPRIYIPAREEVSE